MMLFSRVRTSTKFLLGGLAALILLAVTGYVWLDRQFQPMPPTNQLPALVRDLPIETAEIQPEFRRRVRAHYRNGMQASALAGDLRRKGFRLHEARDKGLQIASLTQSDPICSSTWIVHWRPDPQDRAQDIGAHFNLGCL